MLDQVVISAFEDMRWDWYCWIVLQPLIAKIKSDVVVEEMIQSGQNRILFWSRTFPFFYITTKSDGDELKIQQTLSGSTTKSDGNELKIQQTLGGLCCFANKDKLLPRFNKHLSGLIKDLNHTATVEFDLNESAFYLKFEVQK